LLGKNRHVTNPNLMVPGRFYLGEYDPINKNMLWDRYPLLLVLERPTNGEILGLNFHFVSKLRKIEVFWRIQELLAKGMENSVGRINYLACKTLFEDHDVMTRRYKIRRFRKNTINIPYEYIKLLIMMNIQDFSVKSLTDDTAYKILFTRNRK